MCRSPTAIHTRSCRPSRRTWQPPRQALADAVQWFRENGPDSPELLAHLRRHGGGFDRVLFWAYRYAGSFFGLPLVADRSVLVPTAEEDPLIHVDALSAFFARPKGFLFLTPEEEALVTTRMASGTPSAVIGSGLDPAEETVDLRPLDALGFVDPFVLYLGRIDPNKGCQTLIRHFLRYIEGGRRVQLVMAGPASMPIPEHPEIRALGFKPSEGKKKPDRAVKYRGPQGRGLDGGWRYGRLAEEAEGCR